MTMRHNETTVCDQWDILTHWFYTSISELKIRKIVVASADSALLLRKIWELQTEF